MIGRVYETFMQMTMKVKYIIQVNCRESHKLGLNVIIFMIVWLFLEIVTEDFTRMVRNTSLISFCTIEKMNFNIDVWVTAGDSSNQGVKQRIWK